MKNTYNTVQRKRLTDYLEKNCDREIPSSEIIAAVSGNVAGKSTVYRLIGKLCDDGELIRTVGNDGKSVFYRYVSRANACNEHFHLKCEECGKIIHLNCDLMEKFCAHMEKDHGFILDPCSTVICGVCSECKKRMDGKI